MEQRGVGVAGSRVIVAERGVPLLASALLGSAAAGGAGLLILPSPVGFAALAAAAACLAAGVGVYRSLARKYSRLAMLAERVVVRGDEVSVNLHSRISVGVAAVYGAGWRSVSRTLRVTARYSGPVRLRLSGGYTLIASSRAVYFEAPSACILTGPLRGCCVSLLDPHSTNIREARISLVAAARGSVAEALVEASRRGVRGVLRLASGRGKASLHLEASNGATAASVKLAETHGGEAGFSYSFIPSTATILYMEQATVTPQALLRCMGLRRPVLAGFSSARLRLRLVLEAGDAREERSITLNAKPPSTPLLSPPGR